MMKTFLLTLVLACGCSVFGTPEAKTNQCFAYCLDVQFKPTDEPVAWCYGSAAAMKAEQAKLVSYGAKALVRK
jgi:hypothetical protein